MYFSDEMIPGMRKYIKNTAWTGLIYGAVAVVFGVFTVFNPGGTLSFMVGAIGMLLLAHGLLLTITSLIGIKKDNHWYASLGGGILQLLLGLFIVSHSSNISNTALMVSTVGIGLIGVFSGAQSLVTAIRYRDIVKNIWSLVFRGALLFIIGISMLLAPFGFGAAMVRTIGIIAFVFGGFQVWASVRLIKELKVE